MFGIENFSEAIVKYGPDFDPSQLTDVLLFGGAIVLIGMVTIFAVLCLLWGCLAIFKLVFNGSSKKTSKEVVEEVTITPAAPAPSADDEIVAVIAAAIAMAESECSNMKFKVVSFRRK